MTPADRLAPHQELAAIVRDVDNTIYGKALQVRSEDYAALLFARGVRVVSPTDPDSMGAKILRAQTMKQQGGPVWLIERGQPENQSPTIWWRGLQDGRGDFGILEGWTTDANLAKPFPTKADAEEFIGDHEHPVSGPQSHRLWRERATEHLFMSGPTDPDLRAALAPFADAAADWENVGDRALITHYGRGDITVGDLRRARAALQAASARPEPPEKPPHDGSAWDCLECGTTVDGPSVAEPCPHCGMEMVRAKSRGAASPPEGAQP